MKTMNRAAMLLGATCLSSSFALAQSIDEVIVLSTPYQRPANEVISTTEVIAADALQASLDRPIGDALAGLPGVDSAGFGPAVGQPLIRGLGGYRIDVLGNGMSIGDIAPTGGDHANGISLFDAQRIEVLKGPAALRYGAYAATGVVNMFDRHMDDGDDASDNGGEILVGLGDAADETMTALFARRNGYALSAFSQDADNMRIPTHAESMRQLQAEEAEIPADTAQDAESTQNESRGFTVSGQFGDGATKLVLMLNSLEMDYGVPGHAHEEEGDEDAGEEHEEEEVSIDLERQTVHARLTHSEAVGPFTGLRADMTVTSYEQTEFEGSEAATSFDQDALNLRGEATLERGEWRGLVGVEHRDTELETDAAEHEEEGDEDEDEEEHGHGAYLPSTERAQYGVFVFAERESGDWLTELAARFDTIEQEAEAEEHHDEDEDEDEDEEEEHEAHGAVEHDIFNLSAGLARKLGNGLLLGGSVSLTERAPSQVELFAGGRHAAARREEFGSDELDKESATALEVYLRKNMANNQLRVALFSNDYSDFIYLKKRRSTDDEYDYTQQDAELSGIELSYMTGFTLAGRAIDATLNYSTLSGELSQGGNLPAIPPQKIGLSLAGAIGPLNLSLDIESAADQDDTATDELATDGYTQVDIGASWQSAVYDGLTITAALRNATDEEIRHHTSPLKDLVPAAGRDFRLTAKYRF